MENNKKLYAIIGGLVVVIIALIVTVIVLLSGRKTTETVSENPVDNSVAQTTAPEETTDSGFFDNEVNNDVSDDEIVWMDLPFVIDGFEFTCPSEYDIGYYEGVGATVYVSDVFQMKLVVRDGSNAEAIADKSELTRKTIEAGGTILKDVSEATVNGKSYTYFKMELGGEQNVVVFAPAPGDKKRFGGQIYIQNPNLADEEYIEVFDKVISTAVETDKPNSTEDDIYARDIFIAPGEAKEYGTLTYKGKTATFRVPKDFYSTYIGEEDSFVTESYSTPNITVTADIMFYPEDPEFGGPQEHLSFFIDEQILASGNKVNPVMETARVNGRDVYYVLTSYEKNDELVQYFMGVIEFEDKGMFIVKASSYDCEDVTLTYEMFEQFFEVEYEKAK